MWQHAFPEHFIFVDNKSVFSVAIVTFLGKACHAVGFFLLPLVLHVQLRRMRAFPFLLGCGLIVEAAYSVISFTDDYFWCPRCHLYHTCVSRV